MRSRLSGTCSRGGRRRTIRRTVISIVRWANLKVLVEHPRRFAPVERGHIVVPVIPCRNGANRCDLVRRSGTRAVRDQISLAVIAALLARTGHGVPVSPARLDASPVLSRITRSHAMRCSRMICWVSWRWRCPLLSIRVCRRDSDSTRAAIESIYPSSSSRFLGLVPITTFRDVVRRPGRRRRFRTWGWTLSTWASRHAFVKLGWIGGGATRFAARPGRAWRTGCEWKVRSARSRESVANGS